MTRRARRKTASRAWPCSACFFVTQHVQDVLGMRPLAAGLAFLPMALPMIVVPGASRRCW